MSVSDMCQTQRDVFELHGSKWL